MCWPWEVSVQAFAPVFPMPPRPLPLPSQVLLWPQGSSLQVAELSEGGSAEESTLAWRRTPWHHCIQYHGQHL